VSAAETCRLDAGALERLYLELERPIYNVVYRWTWDREEARDLVQEAFVRLWRMRDRVAVTTVRPLLYRIALNLAANRRRWRRLWRWTAVDTLPDRPCGSNADGLERAQREAAVQSAVAALPERLRRVVVLCELGEMSYAEVATVLKIPPGTVSSRRNAAMARLRAALGEEE
jgi:RNA polymerase sigma-70 factor, ECF subfamily